MDSLAPIHLTAMTDSANQFEFDVAFSFLQQDEAVATQINDLLQDRFKTFIFSKAQESIAGTDGEEIFNAVFGEKARTVAVLYRPGWGDTPWTRIEETAIKNRALLRDGYDFATFVMLEESVSPPKWVPKTRIYYSLPKYGIDGAAGALALRIQDQGGERAIESVAARAERLKRAQSLDEAKRQFAFSFEGVKTADAAYQEFVEAIKHSAEDISAAGVPCRTRDVSGGYTLVVGKGVVLVTDWERHYANSLDGAKLLVRFYDGVPRLPGLSMINEKPRQLEQAEFVFGLAGPDRPAWLDRKGKEFSSTDLAEFVLKRFMDLQQARMK
jgi:hypothetical protein